MSVYLPILEAVLLVITIGILIIHTYFFIKGSEDLDRKMKKLHIPFGFHFFAVIFGFLLCIMVVIEFVRMHTEGENFFSFIDWLWYF